MLEKCRHCGVNVLFMGDDCPNCGALKYKMPDKQSGDQKYSKEYRYVAYKVALLSGLVLTFSVLYGWMAIMSINANFHSGVHTGSSNWFVDILSALPVPIRVVGWAIIAALHLWGGCVILLRWWSGVPAVLLSNEGVTGFAFGMRRRTIQWGEIIRMQSSHGYFSVFGRSFNDGQRSEGKNTFVSWSLFMIGIKEDVMTREIDEFRTRVSVPLNDRSLDGP